MVTCNLLEDQEFILEVEDQELILEGQELILEDQELILEVEKGGGHRYLDTWIPKICQVSKKKVSKSIHEYPKVSIFVSFFVDQSHPLNQLSTSSLEF